MRCRPRSHPRLATRNDLSRLDGVAQLDVDAMIGRFRDRAAAVKKRPLPPVEGDERKKFMQQSQLDFQDFAILGDADWTLEDGVLTLRVDLRPSAD